MIFFRVGVGVMVLTIGLDPGVDGPESKVISSSTTSESDLVKRNYGVSFRNDNSSERTPRPNGSFPRNVLHAINS